MQRKLKFSSVALNNKSANFADLQLVAKPQLVYSKTKTNKDTSSGIFGKVSNFPSGAFDH